MNVAIEPAVVAQLVEGLAGRLRARAAALAAQQDSWNVQGRCLLIGNARVTLAEVDVVQSGADISCDCLLAPACAHRAAVALSLPVTAPLDATAGPTGTQTATSLPVAVETPRPAGGLIKLSDRQLAAAAQCQDHCVQLLAVGVRRLPVTLRAGLLADLHRLRVEQLTVADRALTQLLSVDTAAQQAIQLGRLLANLRALSTGTVAPEVLGEARATYRQVGGLHLTAVLAEPIVSAAGYSGVQVTFAGADAQLWTLARLSPSELGGVATHYLAGEPWAGLSDSMRSLSRSQVVVSNATASPTGRLGGGKQVKAAVLGAWAGWEKVADPLRVVSGPISGGDRTALTVNGQRLQLTHAAVRLGAGLGTELFGQARGGRVHALARRAAGGWELVGVQFADERFQLPAELSQVWWPGLDVVERSWLGEVELPHWVGSDPTQWPPASPSVSAVTLRWLARVVDGGAAALAAGAVAPDVAWLRAAGAPFASELLSRLGAAPQVGARRFDGQWESDPHALAQAWFALSQY